MVFSIWRYSHLTLAISSFFFILIAAVTGIILSLEPISEQLKPYDYEAENYSLANTIAVLQKQYDEVLSIEKDHNDFIIASVITKDGTQDRFYINPATGDKAGQVIEKAPLFQFATTLHRSLFLKTTGRIITCIVSFLLLLIAITGIILILKRQGGIQKFFSKVVKENSNQYYHVVLGKWSFIPILILTITGIYLSFEKFSLLPKEEAKHTISFSDNQNSNKLSVGNFELFQNISLDQIKTIEFPFSKDPEDYFTVNLKNRELLVHQYSGSILSEIKHPFISLASSISLTLHTGRGNIIWSVVLFISSASILYFIYSGFSMTIKRRRQKTTIPVNSINKDEAEFVILVGSETGNTYKPATLVFEAIKNSGKKVFINELNEYTNFKNLSHLIVFTSTYGSGEAPENAKKFLKKFSSVQYKKQIQFSVVGFGSLAYPDFCEYASVVDAALQQQPNFYPATSLYKIHNQSFTDFSLWAKEWSLKIGLPIQLAEPEKTTEKLQEFQIINRSELNKDDTFLLQLKPKKPISFQSGDLLEFYPEGESVARYYSIGMLSNNILLSIKKHPHGVATSVLSKLQVGEDLYAGISKNKPFHFPNNKRDVVMIANGTGIAPFLGMLQENTNNTKTHLFWGGRTQESYQLYKPILDEHLKSGKLTNIHIACSRETNKKQYVQDLLKKHINLIVNTLSNKGTIMICGSLAMEKEVMYLLEQIALEKRHTKLKKFSKQIKTDCY